MDLPKLTYLAVANPQRKSEGSVAVEWGPMIDINAMYERRDEEE